MISIDLTSMYMKKNQKIKKVKFETIIAKKKNSLVFSSKKIPWPVVTPLSISVARICTRKKMPQYTVIIEDNRDNISSLFNTTV